MDKGRLVLCVCETLPIPLVFKTHTDSSRHLEVPGGRPLAGAPNLMSGGRAVTLQWFGFSTCLPAHLPQMEFVRQIHIRVPGYIQLCLCKARLGFQQVS